MLSFAPPKEGKNGDYPSITVLPRRNIAVCAYEGAISNKMYCRVGDVQHNTINWKEEIPRGSGVYVRVGLFEKNEKVYIITVYKRVLWRRCCYQINELKDNSRISFIKDPKPIRNCSGIRPTLAVRKDGTVVVVVEDLTYTLRCHVGKIKDRSSEINWKKASESDTIPRGTTPSVAINDKHIILFYRARATNSLKYACGHLTDSITWKVKNQDYSKGIRPNVTLNDNNIVIVTHMSSLGRLLYFGNGTMNDEGQFTAAEESRSLGMGMHPAVCMSDDNRVVEIHKSNLGTRLWVSQGTVLNNNNICMNPINAHCRYLVSSECAYWKLNWNSYHTWHQ
jgi:hypothetical protein